MRGLVVLCAAAVVAAVSPTITVNTSSYGQDVLSYVQASWNVDPSGSYDLMWVAVFPMVDGQDPNYAGNYCGSVCDAPYTTTLPVSFLQTNATSGSHTFIVPNFRVGLRVAVLSGFHSDSPTLLAQSDAIRNIPAGYQYLKVTTDEALDLVVSFHGPAGANPTVQSSVGNFPIQSAVTYQASDLCTFGPAASNGWIAPPVIYSAVVSMAGVTAGGRVTIKVGDSSLGYLSITVPAPQPPSADATWSAFFLADQGVHPLDNSQVHWDTPPAVNTQQGMNYLLDHGYDFGGGARVVPARAFHNGDIAYATGYLGKWEHFFSQETSWGPLSRIPYHVGMGNHEEDGPYSGGGTTWYYGQDSGGECGIPTATFFPNKAYSNGSPSAPVSGATAAFASSDRWYVRTEGPVAVVMWDTEQDCSEDSTQYQWIESALQAIDRTATPWVILFGHRPIYTGADRNRHLGVVEELLIKYKVSVSLYGHVHNTQVFCPLPLYGDSCTAASPTGLWVDPIHAVIGNAGMGLNSIDQSSRAVFGAADFGFSTIAANNTHLEMKLWTNPSGPGIAPKVQYSFITHQ